MQADCYLCLREAHLKITRVALHLIGSNRNYVKWQHSSVYCLKQQGVCPEASLNAVKLLKMWAWRLTTYSAFPVSPAKNTQTFTCQFANPWKKSSLGQVLLLQCMICLIEMESASFGERREEGSSVPWVLITCYFFQHISSFFRLVRPRADNRFLLCFNHTLHHATIKENIPLK